MFNGFLQSYDTFLEAGIESPLLETLRLYDILSQGNLRKMDHLLEQEGVDLLQLAQKRKEGMPLEYIVGKTVFMGIEFYCSPATLIPREETELLVNVALKFIKKRQDFEDDLAIIDVGTGCGNIAVSLAMNTENTKILASDISSEAVEIAQKHVDKYNLQERVALFCGDGFSPFFDAGYEGIIDIVGCNPPYIPTSSLDKLSSEIIDHEPRVAFDAGPYGIGFFRKLIAGAASILKPAGILTFEIGVGQEGLITRLIERNKMFENIGYFTDDAGQIRVISAVKKSSAT